MTKAKAKTTVGTTATKKTPARSTARAAGKKAGGARSANRMADAATEATRMQAGIPGAGPAATLAAKNREGVLDGAAAGANENTAASAAAASTATIAGEAGATDGTAQDDPTAGMSEAERTAFFIGRAQGFGDFLELEAAEKADAEARRLAAEAERPVFSPYAQQWANAAVANATEAGRGTLQQEYERLRLEGVGLLEALAMHAQVALVGLKWEAENHAQIAHAVAQIGRLHGLAVDAVTKRLELGSLDAFLSANREAGAAQAAHQ